MSFKLPLQARRPSCSAITRRPANYGEVCVEMDLPLPRGGRRGKGGGGERQRTNHTQDNTSSRDTGAHLGNSTRTRAEGIQRYSSFTTITLLHVNEKEVYSTCVRATLTRFIPVHRLSPRRHIQNLSNKIPKSSIHKHISLSCGMGYRKGQVLRNKAVAFIPSPRVSSIMDERGDPLPSCASACHW